MHICFILYTCVQTRHVSLDAWMYRCRDVHMHILSHTSSHVVRVRTYAYIFAHVRIYIYIYIYIYIHIHTHTHTLLYVYIYI